MRYKEDIHKNIWTTQYLNSACLYDPTSGMFSVTGNMNVPHRLHSAIALQNGTVLIAGGATGAGSNTEYSEIFNPVTGTFAYTGNMNTPG